MAVEIRRGLFQSSYEHPTLNTFILTEHRILAQADAIPENYRGKGSLHYIDAKSPYSRLILGDVYKDATLREYLVENRETPQSAEYGQGFVAGWKCKRVTDRVFNGRTPEWIEGWQSGRMARKDHDRG
jgi:hypothetical protein